MPQKSQILWDLSLHLNRGRLYGIQCILNIYIEILLV